MVKSCFGCISIIIIALLVVLLPLQFIINTAHWFIELLLIILLAALVWGTFTAPGPLVLQIFRGKELHIFPNIPPKCSVFLEVDPPELISGFHREGGVYLRIERKGHGGKELTIGLVINDVVKSLREKVPLGERVVFSESDAGLFFIPREKVHQSFQGSEIAIVLKVM